MTTPEHSTSPLIKNALGWPRGVLWILAAFSPLIGIPIAISIVLFGTELLVRLCPPDKLISGTCIADWYDTAETAVVSCAFSAGAVLFVVLPTMIAPRHKRTVALLAFLSGLSLVATVGLKLLPLPSFIAILVGALTAITMRGRLAGAA